MAKQVSIEWTVTADGGVSMDIIGMEGSACKPFHDDVTRDIAPFIGELASTDKPEMKSGPQRASVNPIAATRVNT